jgi:hypothetical protein
MAVKRRYLVWPMVAPTSPLIASAAPSGPRNGGDVFRYRLHSPDGDDLGEATYAMVIKPGEEIHLGAGKRFRVLDIVPLEDDSPLVGLLQVEAA